jgi:hypothetical protein
MIDPEASRLEVDGNGEIIGSVVALPTLSCVDVVTLFPFSEHQETCETRRLFSSHLRSAQKPIFNFTSTTYCHCIN